MERPGSVLFRFGWQVLPDVEASMVRSTRKAWASVAVGLIVVALSACKASEKVVVDSVETSSWVRCALGQSFVGEAGDDQPTQYGAATEAWRDYFCVNEDTGALWWDRLDVYARKYHGSYLCETSATYWTTTSRSVSVSDSAQAGESAGASLRGATPLEGYA